MKIRYFADTDTLHIEFKDVAIVETRDLDENTLLDLDAHGRIAAITVEHASPRSRRVQRPRSRLIQPRSQQVGIPAGRVWPAAPWGDGAVTDIG